MQQRSPEWFRARCGLVTASRFADVMAKIKNGESAGRRNYRAQIVCERLTGQPADTYTNAAMQWGTEIEPMARAAYENITGELVEETGFIKHPDLLAGASPDGLIGNEGLIEIKCPNTATHIDTLLNGVPPGHIPQVQGQLWITGRKWCDFVSFDPRMPENLRFFSHRVLRDESYIEALSKEVALFIAEINTVIQKLQEIK